ncbi:MAG: hypothetical protein H6825_01265 [Planctomycetes bacterium]|nr:hypothetical protein [Planctomycetota bacterium]
MIPANDANVLRRSALRGLLWMDYQRHKEGFLVGLPMLAVAMLAVGAIDGASGPLVFWMGLAMGVACGLGFGTGEWTQGVEEYSLGLPPTRRDRYLVRFALGLAFLLPLYVLGLASGPLGWTRALWELTPFELPAGRLDSVLWDGFAGPGFCVLGIGLSLAVFAETYAVSINVERRGSPWFVRLVPFGVGAALVAVADSAFFPDAFGYLTGLLGLAWVAPRTVFGARAFERKDVVLDGPTTGGGTARPAPLLAVLLGVLAAIGLFVWALAAKP